MIIAGTSCKVILPIVFSSVVVNIFLTAIVGAITIAILYNIARMRNGK